MRVDIHVRPNSSRTRVGGAHDGVLVVRVTAPAERGKATDAALAALADSLSLPRRVVSLASGTTSRRKVVNLAVAPSGRAALEARLAQLREGPGRS